MSHFQTNIWIFGGTGFIGRTLVTRLSACHKNSLHLLIHRNRPYANLEALNTFSGSLQKFDSLWFEKFPPAILFHLARPAGRNSLTRFFVSLLGEIANVRLTKILRALPVPPALVYVSGSLMYGLRTRGTPALEDSDLNPLSFAASYSRLEKPFSIAREKGFLDVRIARPGWIVGPSSWFREFFWKPYLMNGKVPCYGDGTQQMSIIHLDDCAALIAAMGQEDFKNRDLNIFSGQPISQKQFSGILTKLLNTKMMMVPFRDACRLYGKTAALALTSSIPLGTLHEDIYSKTGLNYPDPESILADVIDVLKNEQRVLTKSP